MSTIYYGAVSEPIRKLSLNSKIRFELRKKLYQNIDLYKWKNNDLSTLNYKNYDSHGSTNMGDVAITEAAEEFFSKYTTFTDSQYCNWGNLQKCMEKNDHRKNDTLIVPGGGYFMLGKNGDLSTRIDIDSNLIEKNNIKLVLFGVGINQPFEQNSEPSIKDKDIKSIEKILHLAETISVRDKLSQKLLSKFTSKSVELIGDPALHLFNIKYNQSKKEYQPHKKLTLNVGINFSFHGPTSEELFKKNVSSYISALKKIQSITGCTFYYFIHYESAKIIPKLLAQKGIYCNIIYGSPEILINGYANMDIHIGGMLHSCILAHGVDTPAIAISYDIKHKGFYELFNMPDNCLSAYDFEESRLVNKTVEILSDIKNIENRIKTTRDIFENLTSEHVKNCNLSISRGNVQ